MISIGVLALQGDFAEHVVALRRIGAEAREVRTPEDLKGVHGLIIPGGESTAISRLMDRWGLRQPILDLAQRGAPIWGTCAGLIMVAKNILDDPIKSLGLLDVDVHRNAYGSQLDSFEAEFSFPALGEAPMRAFFIRAPVITRTGPGVTILARLTDGTPIAVKEDNLIGSSFHPELTPDTRFHAYLVTLAKERSTTTHAAAI